MTQAFVTGAGAGSRFKAALLLAQKGSDRS